MRKLFILLCMGTSLLAPLSTGQASDWLMFGNHPSNDLHQAESSRLSPSNAGKLQMLWSTNVLGPLFKTAVIDASGTYLATNSHAYRLNKETGAIVWEKSIDQLTRECPAVPGNELPPDQGIIFLTETSPAIEGDQLVFSTLADPGTYSELNPVHSGGGFVVITSKDGNCLHRIRLSENAWEGVLGSPTIHQGIAYVGISSYEEQAASFPGYVCCSTIGKVCAVDIAAGSKKWCTNLVDADPSTPERDITATIDGQEIDLTGISGITVWSSAPAVDEINQQVIVTTGNAYTINPDMTPEELSALPEKSVPVDAFVGIDLATGVIKNVHRVVPDDFWNVDCLDQGAGNCEFEPQGPDYDFGSGVNLIDVNGVRIVVAINKAGIVHAVDAANFDLLWDTQVGQTTLLGLAGSATDGTSVYASNPVFFDIDLDLLPESPFLPRSWQLINCPASYGGDCPTAHGGVLTALDPASGEIRWQNTDPSNLIPLPDIDMGDGTNVNNFGKAPYLGPPTASNGLVFQGSIYPNFLLLDPEEGAPPEVLATVLAEYPNSNILECPFEDFLSGMCEATFESMYAFDAVTGERSWSFAATGPVIAGAAISDGVVYWGSLNMAGDGTMSTVYAFAVPPEDSGIVNPPAGTGPTAVGPNPLALMGGCSLQRSATSDQYQSLR